MVAGSFNSARRLRDEALAMWGVLDMGTSATRLWPAQCALSCKLECLPRPDSACSYACFVGQTPRLPPTLKAPKLYFSVFHTYIQCSRLSNETETGILVVHNCVTKTLSASVDRMLANMRHEWRRQRPAKLHRVTIDWSELL